MLLGLLNQEAGHLCRDEAASNAILVTWQISFGHVQNTRQSAAELLSLMSFFDRQRIPEGLLRSQSSTASEHMPAVSVDDRFENDILMLRDYSFVTATKDENSFEMHSLVQLAMRKWLKSQEQIDKWREQFISNLCAEFPSGEYENWETCQALFPHARAALTQRPTVQKSLEEWALLLNKAASYSWQRGRAGDAERMSVVSMEVRREMLGDESVEMLDSMNMVGLARGLGAKYEEAEAMHRQTLAIREKVLGYEHPSTLMSVYRLAHLLANRCRYVESLALYDRACAAHIVVLGEEHPTTRACNQHRSEVLALQEQSCILPSLAKAHNGARIHSGKISRLSRGLAKLGIRRSEHNKE